MAFAHVPALDDATLQRMHGLGDPEADAVMAEVFPSGREGVVALNRLLAQVVYNNDPLPAQLPKAVREFLVAGDTIGTAAGGWDEARLQRGAEFFNAYGTPIALTLQLATMPTLYAASNAVKVLTFTGRLAKYAHKRSIETAQMVFDAMHEDGFRPGGAGRRSVQKVRLIHAAVRQFVRASGWDEERDGVPLNLEDTLGVLGGFTCVVVHALSKFGAEFSDQDIEDYYYRWRVVGELIGIPREFLPTTYADMRTSFQRMKDRQVKPSPEGRRLIRAWIESVEQMVPGRRFDYIVEPMIRYLVADDVAAALELSEVPADFRQLLEGQSRVLSIFDQLAGRGSIERRALNAMANTLMHTQLAYERGTTKRVGYALPLSIDGRWELRTRAEAEGQDSPIADGGTIPANMKAFADELDEPARELLHASIARVVTHIALADGKLDHLERAAASEFFERELVDALGDDFRWSEPARRQWSALCEWKRGEPEPGQPGDIAALGDVVSRMPRPLRACYKQVVTDACIAVAAASAEGLWDTINGRFISDDEREAFQDIARSLGIRQELEIRPDRIL